AASPRRSWLSSRNAENSDDRDRLHLDEIVRVRERADLHHRRARSPGAEELLAHGPEVRTIAHVGDVGGDLDDAVERAAPGLDERPDRVEDRARLSLEVAAVYHAALCAAWARRIRGVNGRAARKPIELSQKSSA